MSDNANSEGVSESEKPVQNDSIQFPPFPDPKDEDFDEDIGEDERNHYKNTFKDLTTIKSKRLHCTACDRHLGCAARNEARMRAHPMLRTLVCHNCHIFYNSGEFEKGDDGSELYCRWCGQGGQVYCCSDCPHVFCAKCIKRNLGTPKIKEIENADDWKCFKCNSKCLWDLRALCWAVLRYCDLKNKMAYQAQDQQLKDAYKKDCSIDYSECCKHKTSKRVHKAETSKKKEIKKEADSKSADSKSADSKSADSKSADAKSVADAKAVANTISKIPPTIQVKKFAAVNIVEDIVKQDKKAQKRSLSPKNKQIFVKNPINIAPCPPLVKRMRFPNAPMVTNPVRVFNDRKPTASYSRIRPKPPQLQMPIANCSFNGFGTGFNSNAFNSDNINLSLESLTQGLDMAAVAAISQNAQDDDVVCTPDFPMEPLCEVSEDNDDDVQCITPGPVVPPKISNTPTIIARSVNSSSADITSDNIVQMTDNDVTVNANTGGLKFRVDPQTLSSNKMYRLPDGRIFAINANPTMPGGYSATIVAVTEPTSKVVPKGVTYAAKLSAVTSSSSTPKPNRTLPRLLKRSTPKSAKVTKANETSPRNCDLNVPVEWYRYNLVDAVDAMEYALSRLHKLKKDATTVYLRTRTVNEMRNLHRTLERLLNTSASRFKEIRETLNKGLKQYVSRKSGGDNSEDDDDVEILPDLEDNDDPIFIDENSVESTVNGSESQEVDLTGAGSSEYNDSGENLRDPVNVSELDNETRDHGDVLAVLSQNNTFGGAIETEITIQESDNVEKSDNDNTNKADSENVKDNGTEDKVEKSVNKSNMKNETENNVKEGESDKNTTDHDADSSVIENKSENQVKEKENSDMTSETDTNIPKISTDDIVMEKVTPLCDELKSNETTEKVNGVTTETVKTSDELAEIEEAEDSINHKDLSDKADSQDSDDKMQDTEMSEEMIETLLKDDNVGDESASNLKSMNVSDEPET